MINQYFTPEPGAGTSRVYYHARYLKKLGHEVTVLCGVPNYPSGKIFPGYVNYLWKREYIDGIKVYRTLIYPTRYTSSFRRFINYFVFMISSFVVGLFLQKPDVIISSSPPPSAGISSSFLSYIKRSPLIFEVRDVWPGAALALGYLRNNMILKINLFFERMVYKRARYIIAPTEATKEIIIKENQYLKGKKVAVITNGVDTEIFDSIKNIKKKTRDFNSEGKTVVIYTGTLGLQQGVDNLVEAAKILKDNRKIIFLVIGEGADKHLIEEAISKEKLDNIILKDVVPYSEIVMYLKNSTFGLTLLKKNQYLDAAFPVKAFDYMAARKPVLVCGGRIMGELVERNKAGFWVEPGRPELLASQIEKISLLPTTEIKKMGESGRHLVDKKFNRKKQACYLGELIRNLSES